MWKKKIHGSASIKTVDEKKYFYEQNQEGKTKDKQMQQE